MFDKLLELLHAVWRELIPIQIVSPYNGGVQMRMGKYVRTLPGGTWYWKAPFVDTILVEHVVPRTERLAGLATTTIDGKSIGFDAVVTWRIHNVETALMDVVDLKDAIADSCAGIIGTELSNMTWTDIIHGNTVEALTSACRKRGWRWGVEIQQVQLTGVAPVKNLRVSLNGHEPHVRVYPE